MKFFLFLSMLIGCLNSHAKITSIEKAVVEAAKYNVTRALDSYKGTLDRSFPIYLRSLTKNDTWIDSGAGDALAPIDYLRTKGLAKIIAIDARAPENKITLNAIKKYSTQFKYRSGRYIQEYNPKELFPAKLITDVLGATAYASQLDEVLNILLNSLKEDGGRLYFQMDEATTPSEPARNENDQNVLVRIINGQRYIVPFSDWYNSISGVRFFTGRSGDGGHETSYFIRLNGPIVFPKLKLEKYEPKSEGCPRRIYLWE